MKIPNQWPRVWMILLNEKQARCKVADQEASTVFYDQLEEKNSITSNNQRLQSAGDNDRRSKRFGLSLRFA